MLPQVIENQKQRRVKGLSHLLVACNNFGDTYKLVFFIIEVILSRKTGAANSVYRVWNHSSIR